MFFSEVNLVLAHIGIRPIYAEKCNDLLSPAFKCKNWFGAKNDLRKNANKLSWRAKLLPWLNKFERIDGFMRQNCLLKKSLNGYLFIGEDEGVIVKGVASSLEPNFFYNYITAERLFPELSNPVIRKFRFNAHDVLMQKIIPIKRRLNWRDWEEIYPNIINQLLGNIFASGHFIVSSAREIKMELDSNISNSIGQQSFLKIQFNEIFNLFNEIYGLINPNEAFDSLPIVIQFAHGDLTPDNCLYTGDRFILIDWDNGGNHCCFYDLIIPKIYDKDALAWKKFHQISMENIFNAEFFGPSGGMFVEHLQRVLGVEPVATQIKLGILFSIVEMAVKNFKRHQSDEWQDDGGEILVIIKEVLLSIRDSISPGQI